MDTESCRGAGRYPDIVQPPVVYFDLDGTLTDSAPGILNSLKFALSELGFPEPDAESMRQVLGPPIQHSFARLLGTTDAEQIAHAVKLYRKHFIPVGMFENEVYIGVREMLQELKFADFTIYIATAKPTVFARQITDHFGLTRFFDAIYGSELTGERGLKSEVIAYGLAQTGKTGWMVGDREHDVIGAHQNQMPCLGVTYGYGTISELQSVGVDDMAGSPAEVTRKLLRFR